MNGTLTVGEYFYDGDGKRIKKIEYDQYGVEKETTIFVYDASGRLVAEYSTVVATGTDAKVSYLTNDHLGSPRITTDKDGGVISRRDFMPFGEEISTSQRTAGLGYAGDTVRRKFTSYERDIESDLDFAQNRYYNSNHGRFTTVDPLMASADIISPQTFNRYVYVGNNPVNITDPTGLIWGTLDGVFVWYKDRNALDTAGATVATVFYGVIQGTTQLAVLNPNANVIAEVASGAAALEQLAAWGAGAAAVEATAIALGVVATGVAAKASADALGEDANCMMDPGGCGQMQGWRLYNKALDKEMKGLEEAVPPVEDTVPVPPNPDDPNKPTFRYAHKLKESTLKHIRTWSTEKITDSLKPGSKSPLTVYKDGTIAQGNHRIQVLRERGINVDALPRETRVPDKLPELGVRRKQ